VRRTKPPTSSLIAPGDRLVYANGERERVISLLWLNGQPGVQLDCKNPLYFSDRFKLLEEVERWVRIGTWQVERAGGEA
jgi:hypothetical protein